MKQKAVPFPYKDAINFECHPLNLGGNGDFKRLRNIDKMTERGTTQKHIINEAIFNGLLGVQENITVGIAFDNRDVLSGMLNEDVIQIVFEAGVLVDLDEHIGDLPLRAAKRLMHVDGGTG